MQSPFGASYSSLEALAFGGGKFAIIGGACCEHDNLAGPPALLAFGRCLGLACYTVGSMSDSALRVFLSLLQRELGADDAYLQLGGKATEGEGRFYHAVGEATSLVVAFAEPPIDATAVRSRLSALSATFRKTLDSAVAGAARPQQATDFARQRLDEELSGLSERAGAVRAFVIDFDSPVIWGASVLEPQHLTASKPVLERAAQALRQRSDELRQTHGHTVRLTLEDGVEALARPFAGIYVLSLLFQDPLSEPIAIGAVLHAAGLIERLVLALPPIDPGPGAKVIRLDSAGPARID